LTPLSTFDFYKMSGFDFYGTKKPAKIDNPPGLIIMNIHLHNRFILRNLIKANRSMEDVSWPEKK